MIATRTRSSRRGFPLVEAIGSFRVRPRRSESVSTMSSLVVRRRSFARCASRCFSSAGIRRSTWLPPRGGGPARPLGSKWTATLAARWPTATSFRPRPVRVTSSASRRLSAAGEDQGDRTEHEALAHPVGGRVEEGAERRRLAAGAGEGPVEDVEDRSDHEHGRPEPVEEELVAVLEVDENAGGDAEHYAGRR